MNSAGQAGVLSGVRLGGSGGAAALRTLFAKAFAREVEERRLSLWIAVAAIAGVSLYFAVDREPPLWLSTAVPIASGALAYALRHRVFAFAFLIVLATLSAGFCSA